MKKYTKTYKNETCKNTLDLELLPFMKTPAGKKATFYCIKYNKMTCVEDCKKCQYFK